MFLVMFTVSRALIRIQQLKPCEGILKCYGNVNIQIYLPAVFGPKERFKHLATRQWNWVPTS